MSRNSKKKKKWILEDSCIVPPSSDKDFVSSRCLCTRCLASSREISFGPLWLCMARGFISVSMEWKTESI